MHRDYDGEDGQWNREFCLDHVDLPEHAREITPYLSLIPAHKEKQCKHVSCSICNSVWITDGLYRGNLSDYEAAELGSDFEDNDFYWRCDCKEKESGDSNFYNWNSSWTGCKKNAVYGGYFSLIHKKYFRLLKRHLEYVAENKLCNCYWPEKTEFAAKINDYAYELIYRLFTDTPLDKLLKDEIIGQKIHGASELFDFTISLNRHEATRALICHCFKYSDYDLVLEELDFVSKNNLKPAEYSQVQVHIEKIRRILCANFIKLNNLCYKKHPHPHIKCEIEFVNSIMSQLSKVENSLRGG